MYTTWRLIDDIPRDAAENMAVDEAIAISMSEDDTLPTLRFYKWKSPAVSYGYFQKVEDDVNIPYCRSKKIDFVRRPTGGGIVLHMGELTYSLIVNLEFFPGSSDVISTYRIVHGAIKSGLMSLGIKGVYGCEEKGMAIKKPGFCFTRATKYDVMVNNSKIAGSAQRRFDPILLHQGYIMIEDIMNGSEILLKGHCRNGSYAFLREFVTEIPSKKGLIKIFKNAFENKLDIKFSEKEITGNELKTALSLKDSKYSLRTWNFMR